MGARGWNDDAVCLDLNPSRSDLSRGTNSHARMGLLDARSSSTQSLILVLGLFTAYVFGVFDQFSLWFLVFALLLPLLFFFGNDLRIPLILDETTGLSEKEHGRMGLLLLLVGILLLPAAQPVMHEQGWDDPLTHTLIPPEAAVLQEDGTWLSSTEVRITNPSALMKPFAVSAVMEHPGQGWTLSWDCDGEDAYTVNGDGCGGEVQSWLADDAHKLGLQTLER